MKQRLQPGLQTRWRPGGSVRLRLASAGTTVAALLALSATPAEQPAAPIVGSGVFPSGTGQPQVQAACGPCHAVTIVTSARKSEVEWERTVNAMVTRGARVPDEDYDIILDYLIANFSAS